MASQRIEDALRLLRAEYLDSPRRALTSPQVADLLDVDWITAQVVLEALEDSRFLEQTSEGRYVRHRHSDIDGAVTNYTVPGASRVEHPTWRARSRRSHRSGLISRVLLRLGALHSTTRRFVDKSYHLIASFQEILQGL